MTENMDFLISPAYLVPPMSTIFFATFTGTHSGDGGPVPPTNQTTNSHYVYALKMNAEGKIERMAKISDVLIGAGYGAAGAWWP